MKPETTKKLLALKNYLGACENLTAEQKAAFSQMIEQVFYAETPLTNGKFDIYKFTNPKDRHEQLRGVYYDNGTIAASDGYILTAVKQEYPAEHEGLIIDKNGEKIDAKYPNYKGVFPLTEGWPTYQIDFAKVRNIIKRSKAWARANGKKQNCHERLIKVGPAFFRLDYFEILVSGMEHIENNVLMIKDKITAAVCKNDKGNLLLMPFCEPSDKEGVFIEELKQN